MDSGNANAGVFEQNKKYKMPAFFAKCTRMGGPKIPVIVCFYRQTLGPYTLHLRVLTKTKNSSISANRPHRRTNRFRKCKCRCFCAFSCFSIRERKSGCGIYLAPLYLTLILTKTKNLAISAKKTCTSLVPTSGVPHTGGREGACPLPPYYTRI